MPNKFSKHHGKVRYGMGILTQTNSALKEMKIRLDHSLSFDVVDQDEVGLLTGLVEVLHTFILLLCSSSISWNTKKAYDMFNLIFYRIYFGMSKFII